MNDLTFEKNYWGNCVNTAAEELKQTVYAELFGLKFSSENYINVEQKSILDVGAGPVSLLLKTHNLKKGTVIDPLIYPQWVYERYSAAGIKYIIARGEDMPLDTVYDECWMYNCLQHVDDPEKIIENIKKVSNHLRIFEWIDIPPHQGHPHELKKDKLEQWIGAEGYTKTLNHNGCYGKCFYGVFKFSK
jgi:SAM-dependent methyltransferase